jgi:hypothetical protein
MKRCRAKFMLLPLFLAQMVADLKADSNYSLCSAKDIIEV